MSTPASAARPATGADRSVPAAGVVVVAVAAGLWGTDALFRQGLALAAPSASVVLWEHAVLSVLLALPLWRRRDQLVDLTAVDWWTVAIIGVGASAMATLAFTRALAMGDPTTPLLLQKVQPLVAMAFAAVVLGERPRRRLAAFVVPSLAGAWLITFEDPTSVSAGSLVAAALAVTAATLWALGTVLGRRMSDRVDPTTLTALRLTIGLPAAAVAAVVTTGAPVLPTTGQLPAVLGLALVPGLLALVLYYRGLRRAPASLATLAELAFPLTAIVVGRVVFGTTLSPTQWLGVVLLSGSVTVLSIAGRRGSRAAGVTVADDTREPALAGT